jgi:hypothetical protein
VRLKLEARFCYSNISIKAFFCEASAVFLGSSKHWKLLLATIKASIKAFCYRNFTVFFKSSMHFWNTIWTIHLNPFSNIIENISPTVPSISLESQPTSSINLLFSISKKKTVRTFFAEKIYNPKFSFLVFVEEIKLLLRHFALKLCRQGNRGSFYISSLLLRFNECNYTPMWDIIMVIQLRCFSPQ